MASTNLTDSARIVLEAACQYTLTQARILFYGGGTFVLFSVLSGLVVVMLRAIFALSPFCMGTYGSQVDGLLLGFLLVKFAMWFSSSV
jgi:hypothetical protein